MQEKEQQEIMLQCVDIAAAYLESELHEKPNEFQFRYVGIDSDSGFYSVDALHQIDLAPESEPTLGGSDRSRRLLIDLAEERVKEALRFQ